MSSGSRRTECSRLRQHRYALRHQAEVLSCRGTRAACEHRGVRWQIQLDGDGPDLDMLAQLFPSGDLYVVQEDGATFLAGRTLDALSEPGDARALAEELLPRINGAALALEGDFRPVHLAGRMRDADNPQNGYALAITAEASARANVVATVTVTDAEGNVRPPPPPPGPPLMLAAGTDPVLAEALRWMGAADGPSWADLWKSFETLRQAAGGEKALVARCGVAHAEVESFRTSANDPTISGDRARHAVQTRPPAAPMTLEQGREFVGRLLRGWAKV